MIRPERPIGVVCGSDSLVGNALVSRFAREGWDIITIDDPGTRVHEFASHRAEGDLTHSRVWKAASKRIVDSGLEPHFFVHTPTAGFDQQPVLDLTEKQWRTVLDRN